MDTFRVALVTGAGTGIGRAAALALLGAGWRVVLAGRRREPLDGVVTESGAGARALAVPADVADPASVQALFAATTRRVWPAGPAVQQRRGQCAWRAAGRPDDRAVEERGGHQPDRHVLLHPAGVSRHEGAKPPRRTHHQQRLDLGACAAAQLDCLHRDQARGDGPDQVASLDGRKYDIAVGQIDVGNAATEMASAWPRVCRRPMARSPSSR
jgi:NAD(P)-dependent dehydrogenase (short-subunit alcohol dehydrogenase family)